MCIDGDGYGDRQKLANLISDASTMNSLIIGGFHIHISIQGGIRCRISLHIDAEPVPKRILELMNVRKLTRENVAVTYRHLKSFWSYHLQNICENKPIGVRHGYVLSRPHVIRHPPPPTSYRLPPEPDVVSIQPAMWLAILVVAS